MDQQGEDDWRAMNPIYEPHIKTREKTELVKIYDWDDHEATKKEFPIDEELCVVSWGIEVSYA